MSGESALAPRLPLGFAAGDPNLSRYVSNSPTNWTDPSGLYEAPPHPATHEEMIQRAEEIQKRFSDRGELAPPLHDAYVLAADELWDEYFDRPYRVEMQRQKDEKDFNERERLELELQRQQEAKEVDDFISVLEEWEREIARKKLEEAMRAEKKQLELLLERHRRMMEEWVRTQKKPSETARGNSIGPDRRTPSQKAKAEIPLGRERLRELDRMLEWRRLTPAELESYREWEDRLERMHVHHQSHEPHEHSPHVHEERPGDVVRDNLPPRPPVGAGSAGGGPRGGGGPRPSPPRGK